MRIPAGGSARGPTRQAPAHRHHRGRLPGEPLLRPLLRLRALRRAPRRAGGLHAAGRAGGTVEPFHFTSLSTTRHPALMAGRPRRVERRARWTASSPPTGSTAWATTPAGRAAVLLRPARALHVVCELFCSVLGPSYPNQLYLAAGTSGGVTTNDVAGLGHARLSLILDLLDAAGVCVEGLQRRSGHRTSSDNVFARFGKTTRATSARGPAERRLSRGRGERRLPTCRSSSPSSGLAAATSTRRPTSRSGCGSRSSWSRRSWRDRSGRAPPTCSPTTSTAGTSTTCRRRRPTPTGSAYASRRGSSHPTQSPATSKRPCSSTHRS